MSQEGNESRDLHSPRESKDLHSPRNAKSAALSQMKAKQGSHSSPKKPAQRKLTPKQQMKAKRMKEKDEKQAMKQKANEIRASYTALTPCKTTLDPSEREPVVGDKLIVRDEYNIKCVTLPAPCSMCIDSREYDSYMVLHLSCPQPLSCFAPRYPANVLKEVRDCLRHWHEAQRSRTPGVSFTGRRNHKTQNFHPLFGLEQ
jgi:hypothetical protein